jgi:hypothetical protein
MGPTDALKDVLPYDLCGQAGGADDPQRNLRRMAARKLIVLCSAPVSVMESRWSLVLDSLAAV